MSNEHKTLLHNAFTSQSDGSSGSPVLNETREVVAVHCDSSMTYKKANAATADVFFESLVQAAKTNTKIGESNVLPISRKPVCSMYRVIDF